jgi:hypothetical protein
LSAVKYFSFTVAEGGTYRAAYTINDGYAALTMELGTVSEGMFSLIKPIHPEK